MTCTAGGAAAGDAFRASRFPKYSQPAAATPARARILAIRNRAGGRPPPVLMARSQRPRPALMARSQRIAGRRVPSTAGERSTRYVDTIYGCVPLAKSRQSQSSLHDVSVHGPVLRARTARPAKIGRAHV